MKQTLKRLAIRTALEGIALFRLGKRFPEAAGRGVIFTLHHVRPKQPRAFDPNAHLEATPEFLETAILAAKEAGLRPVPLDDLPNLLKNGEAEDRYCAFTLDDGYRNNAEFAAPVFRKHNVPYTIFVCPGFVQRKRILWWESLTDALEKAGTIIFDFGNGRETLVTDSFAAKGRAFDRIAALVGAIPEDEAVARIENLAKEQDIDPMQRVRDLIMDESDLVEIAADPLCTLGAHTMTHCNLKRVEQSRLENEITQSMKLVSDWSGKPVTTFAYPYGWLSAAGKREFETAKRLGITVGVTTIPGTLNDRLNVCGLPRVSLNGHYQKRRYVEALLTGLPFSLV